MYKALLSILLVAFLAALIPAYAGLPKRASGKATIKISREELFDKIYGGWVGMLIGGLEGFNMPDTYTNKTRPQLPATMKISEQAEIMMRLCKRVISENGGEILRKKEKTMYKIKLQQATIQEALIK